LVSILFVPCLDFIKVSIINFVANEIHEHIEHDMSVFCFSSELEGLAIMGRVNIGLGISIIELEKDLLGVFWKVVVIFAKGF